MGQKDLPEKILADYNDVFADIINVLLFHGEEKIQPEELKNTSVHSQYKADDGKLHEEERDVVKYWEKSGVEIALCGLENQSLTEKHMPFRVIGYDGAAYRSQLLNKKKKIVPVVTLVLYFGTEKHWDKPCSIKELMQIPTELGKYVNDYKIHVFEIAWLTEEQLKMFQSDFGIVANFFVQKRKNKEYVPDDTRALEHVDEVLKLLSVMTGDNSYESILSEQEGRVNNMCEVADRLKKQGKVEGKAEAENAMAKLFSLLLNAGRIDDAKLAADNEEARKKFCKEFGIID